MGTLIALIAAIAAVLVITAVKNASTPATGSRKQGSTIRRKMPLTKNEQPMYFRLVEAFPEHVVLAQVAFSALITTARQATRNRFDRKVADFVICKKAFEVLAIVELDDSSHQRKDEKDAERDKLLTEAGHRVFRYKHVPNKEVVRNEIIGNEQVNKTPTTDKSDMAASLK